MQHVRTQGFSKSRCDVQGIIFKVAGLGDRDEGIASRMASGYFTRRTETCRQVLSMLQEMACDDACSTPQRED